MTKKYLWHPVVETFNRYKKELELCNYKHFEEEVFELGDFKYEKEDISNIGNIVIGNLESLVSKLYIFSALAKTKSTASLPLSLRKNIYDTLFHLSIYEDGLNGIPPSQISSYFKEVEERYGKILKAAKSLKESKGDLEIANMHKMIENEEYKLLKQKIKILSKMFKK